MLFDLKSDNPTILLDKGKALVSLGEFDEAVTCYDRATEIDPNNVDAWNSKGSAFSDLGRYDEAIKSYDRVIEKD